MWRQEEECDFYGARFQVDPPGGGMLAAFKSLDTVERSNVCP